MDQNDVYEMGVRALAAQPFSTLLGSRLVAFSPGVATLEIPVSEKLFQQHGFIHGGVVSYAADNALTFAGGSVMGPQVVTSEFKINYLRPAAGASLLARATVIHTSRRQAVCRCDVFGVDQDGAETLCAVAQGTIMPIGSDAA